MTSAVLVLFISWALKPKTNKQNHFYGSKKKREEYIIRKLKGFDLNSCILLILANL